MGIKSPQHAIMDYGRVNLRHNGRLMGQIEMTTPLLVDQEAVYPYAKDRGTQYHSREQPMTYVYQNHYTHDSILTIRKEAVSRIDFTIHGGVPTEGETLPRIRLFLRRRGKVTIKLTRGHQLNYRVVEEGKWNQLDIQLDSKEGGGARGSVEWRNMKEDEYRFTDSADWNRLNRDIQPTWWNRLGGKKKWARQWN